MPGLSAFRSQRGPRTAPPRQLTGERAALVAHLLGLGAGLAAIIGLIPPVTTLVRTLID